LSSVVLESIEKIPSTGCLSLIFTARAGKSSSSLFNTVCGETHSEKDKKWIIDIDDMFNDDQYLDLVNFLHDLEPIGGKVITNLSSKNGFHIITTPFNMQKFKDTHPTIDVHKNNPTNLYIP
jgi:hypothetical protein